MPGINFKYKYPFLLICTAFMAGILCSHLFHTPAAFPCLWFTISILTLYSAGTEHNFYRKRILKKIADLFLLGTIFTLGSFLARPASPLSFDPSAVYQIKLRCEEQLPHHNFLLSTHSTNLFLSRYDTDTAFRTGDIVLAQARIVPLPDNSNPGEFNYNRYLRQKQTNYRLIPYARLKIIGHDRNIRSVFEELRQRLLQKSEILFPDTVVRPLINALCLGYKNDLDKNIRDHFIQTGTIHLLAVSGLHTGAIYLLLTYLLSIAGLPRHKTDLLTIPLLWGYACLTGLSPSVVRAATILTFIALGKTLERDYTPINAIAASAFFTLLVQPQLIGSVSFLMSYSAYTGIVLFYPYLNRLPGKLPAIPAKLWALCCLSLSAQLLTLPINAYYFHTITPGSVLINLLAIPLATILLYGSVLLFLLPAFIGIHVSVIITWTGHLLLYTLNSLQPIAFNLSGLYPTTWHILFIYLNFLLLGCLLLYKNRLTFGISIATLCLLLVFCCFHNYELASRKELLVFNHYRESTILLNYRGYYTFLYNTSPGNTRSQAYILQNKLKPLPPHSGLISGGLTAERSRLDIPGTSVYVADQHTAAVPPCRILIVTCNALPEKLFEKTSVYPERLIADFSNSYRNLSRCEKFCKEHNIIFETTTKTGCVFIPLK